MTYEIIAVVLGLILAAFGLVALAMTVTDMIGRRQGRNRDAVVIAESDVDLE